MAAQSYQDSLLGRLPRELRDQVYLEAFSHTKVCIVMPKSVSEQQDVSATKFMVGRIIRKNFQRVQADTDRVVNGGATARL